MERKLTHIGNDSWDRPVYEDQTGILFVDTYPLSDCPMELCTKSGNLFDGEPDTPVRYTKYSDDTFAVDHSNGYTGEPRKHREKEREDLER